MKICSTCHQWTKTKDTPRWGHCALIPRYIAADESPNPPGLTHQDFGCIYWGRTTPHRLLSDREFLDAHQEYLDRLDRRLTCVEKHLRKYHPSFSRKEAKE